MAGRGMKRKYEEHESFMSGEISMCDYVNSRAAEVEACSQAVNRIVGCKIIYQRLPQHMRRRAMSHNVKRVPRRLREIANREVYDNQKQNTKYESKRPSRKHRRRPKNLLKEYERRKRKHIWLETHIWHAKRFHMVERWGYRLPLRPTDKGGRAAYRASAKHCLIQDHSYMGCIEIIGSEEKIIEGLKKICSTDAGLTFSAKLSIAGNREGRTIIYRKGKYPHGAIGPVKFLWNPENVKNLNTAEHCTIKRQIWIWTHPACFSDILSEIQECFDSTTQTGELNPTDDQQTSNSGVQVTSLKDKLVRFCLTGPLSQAVIRETLLPANVTVNNNQGDKWWQKYYQDNKFTIKTSDLWNVVIKCHSPGEVPAHCVIGLTVRDPRLFLPPKRTKAMNSYEEIVSEEELVNAREIIKSAAAASSAIWLPHVREDVSKNKETEQKINKMKSENAVPGTQLNLGVEESRIPILLINRPGSSNSSVREAYGCGWDIILPQEWARPFFVAMVYRGARAGGLQEAQKIAAEGKDLFFPLEYPDTKAGDEENKFKQAERKSLYDKKPPSKRMNYIKMGIPYPFNFPWERLLLDWLMYSTGDNSQKDTNSSAVNGQFYVLRDKKVLKQLSNLCHSICSKQNTNKPSTYSIEGLKQELTDKHGSSLVPVTVTSLLRGSPSEYSSIYIPHMDDISELKRDTKCCGPVEPKHGDPGAPKRKEQKVVKKKLKKSIKRGHKSDTLSQGVLKLLAETSESNTVEKHVIDCNARKLFGYMTSGDFMLNTGGGAGKGFCSLIGLLELFEHHSSKKSLFSGQLSGKCVVLTRSPLSLQYRYGHLNIIV